MCRKCITCLSYIGYQTVELKANGKGLDKIMMKEDNELLDEVVVVGYGVQKKRDVTTAIASIRASDLKGQPVTSMAEAMVGKMPGVQVSQSTGAPVLLYKLRCAVQVLLLLEHHRCM